MKAVIIGYGSAGQRHCRILRELGVEIAAIADPMVSDSVKAPIAYCASADKALDIYGRDALVVIASPTDCHARQLEMACAITEPAAIFCEKPGEVGAGRWPTDLGGYDIPVFYGYNYRFHLVVPAIRAALRLFDRPILQMVAKDDAVSWPNYRRDSWLTGPAGGVYLTSVSHSVNLAQHLLGPVVKVESRTYYDTDLSDVETRVSIAMRHEIGAATLVDIDWHGPKKSEIRVGNTGKDIYLRVNMLAFDPDIMMREMWRSILWVLKPLYPNSRIHGDLRLCMGAEAYETLRIIEACKRSAKEGKVVSL